MRYDFSNPATEVIRGSKRLYILGQAKDGPTFEPVHISYPNRAREIFGEGNLLEAYKEASLINDIDIFLVRISGTEARGSLEDKMGAKVLSARTTSGGSKYNGMYLSVQMNPQGVEELLICSSDDSVLQRYSLDDAETFRDLVDRVNKSNQRLSGKTILLQTETPEEKFKDTLLNKASILTLNGGTDGLNLTKNELYFALDSAYSILVGQQVDVICPYVARFDDAHPQFFYGSASYGDAYYSSGEFLTLVDENDSTMYATFYEQLVDFCKEQELSGQQTHGVIGIREVADVEDIRFHYLSRLSRANGLKDRYGLVDFDGNMIDKGYYISIVGQELTYEGRRFNACAVYSAMMTSLDIKENLTMKPFPKEVQLAYELHPQEIADLSYLGVVTGRSSPKYGPVVANSVTAGIAGSPLHSLINVRMVQGTIRLINEQLDELIGSTVVNGVTEKEIETRLAECFRFLDRENVLKEYSYQIAYLDDGEYIEIYIDMTPRNATESISVSTGINVTGGYL